VEYLVTMTTHVPEGTSQDAVQEVRDREAEHSRGLASDGSLLRLWRPPLRPGEWRTLGLFAADDDAELEEVLAGMPLRVWRTDEVTPLAPHPNDPSLHADGSGPVRPPAGSSEFFTTFALTVPVGTPDERVDAALAGEATRTAELGRQGHLERLWRLPGERNALGLWTSRDTDELDADLASLPLFGWLRIETTPLARHPGDPALAGV
jgi:muconolactone delta-isomerase